MPPRMKWRRDNTSATPKPIDIRLDGLAPDGRLQCSSETTIRDAYERRVNAIREAWGKGGVWAESVRALAAKRYGVTRWMAARDAGVVAVEDLMRSSGAEPLADAIRDYLKASRASDKTKMRQRLDRLALYLGGRKATVADLTSSKVDAFLGQLIDQRTAKTTKTPAEGSTVNRYRAVISGLCTWLVRQGRLLIHPIAGKKVEKRAEPHHRLPEMSADEYGRYTSYVLGARPDLYVIPLLLIHTAADVGEVFGLTVRDLDLDGSRVHYHRLKTLRAQRGGSRPRFVPMPAIVLNEVRAHIAEHDVQGSTLAFGMFARRDVEWLHERAAKHIGRPELTLKDLRHVAAIAWVRAGVHIRIVQRWMGHASLSQTMKYCDYEPDAGIAAESAERAADTLNRTAGVIPLRKEA